MAFSTPDSPSLPYAGRLVRFAAYVIDLIVVLIITLILGALGIGGSVFDPEASSDVVASLVSALVFFGYFFVLTTTLGATLGKMALGLRVVDVNGEKASAGSVAVRELLARALGAVLAAVLSPIFGDTGANIGNFIGFVVVIVIVFTILFDARRQGLHDRIGGTFVIRAPR